LKSGNNILRPNYIQPTTQEQSTTYIYMVSSFSKL